MKRRLLKLGCLLLLGAALNVAVAWGLALLTEKIDYEDSSGDSDARYWPQGVPVSWPKDQRWWGKWREPGILLAEADQRRDDPTTDLTVEAWRAARMETGWPQLSMLCLQYECWTIDWVKDPENGQAETTDHSPDWMRGIAPSGSDLDDYPQPGFIPVVPLWPGFTINTLFYAGVLWMLFAGPFALRRMIRRRRGQCAHCAYPIGQNQRCTECGAAHAAVLPPQPSKAVPS